MGYAILVPGADYRQNNLGQVTLTDAVPISAIAIVGPSSIYISGQFSATFIPTFTTQRGVEWSIVSGGEYATISNTGELIGKPEVEGESVTIRCTSSSDSTIYVDKTVLVTTEELVYKDWVTSDGTDFIYTPGLFDIWDSTVTMRCTHAAPNTYVICCMYSGDSTQARIAAYNNGSNRVSAYVGTGGTNNWVTKSNIIYRYVWNLGTAGASNSSGYLYNDATDEQLGVEANVRVTMSGRLGIFRYLTGAPNTPLPDGTDVSLTPSGAKFYGMTVIHTSDDAVLMDLRPCLYGGVAGVYDEVTQTFWPGFKNIGGITAGNDE